MQIGGNPDPSNVGWVQIGLGGLGVAIIGWFGGWLRGLHSGWELITSRVHDLESDSKTLRIDVDKNERSITETQQNFSLVIEALSQKHAAAAERQEAVMNDIKLALERVVTFNQLNDIVTKLTRSRRPGRNPTGN